MACAKRFAKNLPDQCDVHAKERWVATVYCFGQNNLLEVCFVEKMAMLGGKLHRIPKKRIVAHDERDNQDDWIENGLP